MATVCEDYSTVSIWDEKLIQELLREIRLSERVFGNYKPETVDERECVNDSDKDPLVSLGDLEIAKTKTCSVCNVIFDSRQEQVLHFKLDWHCENLKRRDDGLPPRIQENSEKLQGNDCSTSENKDSDDQNPTGHVESDDSSSASDIEVESFPTSSSNLIRRAKIYFENANGDMLSTYKCVILNKKDVPLGEAEVISRLKKLPGAKTWAVLLLGGGHFAGGIFKENAVVVHKTFHRYVTRAKQGSVQSIHDQQRKHAKSAGAQLRRHNELALAEEIQSLCQTWSGLLEECTHVFYRASGNNKRVLFGGKTPLFQKDDGRLCSIPFPTKQATHQEVVRAHGKLSAIECHGRASDWKDRVPQLPEIPVNPRKTTLNRQKLNSPKTGSAQQIKEQIHKEYKDTPNLDLMQNEGKVLQIREMSANKTRQETPQHSRDSSCDDNNENLILDVQEELFSTSALQEFEVVFNENAVLAPVAKDSVGSKKQLSPHFDKEEQRLRNALYTACRLDDSESLQRLLSPLKPGNGDIQNSTKPDMLLQMLNSAFGNTGSTLLHICAQCGYKTLIWMLLECGADPATGDNKGQPAYVLAVNKETRNTFRRFMASFPEKYEYVTAQIPSPLSEETEKAKLMKLQQKRQQRKQKTKALKLEQEEKAKFLNSTDAEKRMDFKTQKGASRCYFCGDSLANKVPFSYDEFKFCTLRCLQLHRRR